MKNSKSPPSSAIAPSVMLDPQSVLRLRIFSFKMLMVIPVSLAVASSRGLPLLHLLSIFCYWHAVFAALAAVVQKQRFQPGFLTAWDESAAFLATALFTRMLDAGSA